MKNIVIKELVEFMINTIEKSEDLYYTSAKSLLSDKTFGKFRIRTNNLKIDKNSTDLGVINIYCDSGGYSLEELFKIEVKQDFYFFWTNNEVKEERKLINRLYRAILKYSDEQEIRIENAKYKKYFDMLPDEKKQNILREEKLKRITKIKEI